ncbi:MAG: type II toxin-antitoxin system VapC family toxin [Terriglobales bacterium]
MATYLLDTSVIVDVLNNKRGRRAFIEAKLRQGHLTACCSVNVTEVFAGMFPHEEARTEGFLRSLEYFEVSWEIARQAGLLKNSWARQGITLPLTDATIAAVALANRLVLLTDNTRHFPMPDLQLEPLPPPLEQ